MKFIADCMLGKLAKWLKILGFDVSYFPRIGDDELLSLAQKEDRVLLTRDTGLVEKAKAPKAFLVKSENWSEQVRQVLNEFNLWMEASPYSRCLECNAVLKDLSRESAKNLVAPFVYEHAVSFALCPRCSRVYWQGTHYTDMKAKIEEILSKSRRF
jgi:uncharacterized protein with PIN domain